MCALLFISISNNNITSMVILNIIKGRRSIRRYKIQDIPYEKILEILEAGIWAPSSGNLQNWYFIVVKDPKKRKQLAEASMGQGFVYEAPVVIVVCSDTKKVEYFYGSRGKFYAIQNVAAAIQNILLEAWSEGIGTCWIGAFDEKRVKEILEIPKDIEVHALVTLGYPDESPSSDRQPLREKVFFERWGNRVYIPKLYPLLEKLEDLNWKFKDLRNRLKKQ